ncbi:unnamed protein product [Adineta ricciae]|uniref:Uncharacterized protein n=1 Tax=Adineta ricciae TaxID=249248 RepID=A0A814J8C9_ADIRI|nr:unnamed protein product [Adineta ricciae]
MGDSYNIQQENEAVSSASTPEYTKYGFNVFGIETIDSRFKCLFCDFVIKEPIQLVECGHRICRGCFDVRAATVENGRVKCPQKDCGEFANKEQVMEDKAFRRELDSLRIICRFKDNEECTWSGILRDYQRHLDENHIHYICPDCHSRFSSQIALDEHVHSCPVNFQRCLLAPYCTDEMIPRVDFEKHCLTQVHQEAVIKGVLGEYNLSEVVAPEQQMETGALTNELDDKTWEKIGNLDTEVHRLEGASIDIDKRQKEMQGEITRIVQGVNTFYSLMNERLPIKQGVQPTQEKLQKDIDQLHQSFENLQHVSNDGTLTWRVDRVSEKIADAQSERQTSIYSPIFYSSSTGYKMRVRLFLFGDGNARRTHISLFFLLMKGDYDAILKWPFSYKVTFCLLDQTDSNRHIIDSFYPDTKSSSFQRPRDAANTASGIPKFFPLTMLLQDDNVYVREDTLYLKIIIGFNDMPKTLLPYMLTLNPALPNYVQENLIQQETIKLQQQQEQQSNAVNNPQSMLVNTGK